MARKRHAQVSRPSRIAPPANRERERIIDAFMALLAEKPIERIGFAEIARAAPASRSPSCAANSARRSRSSPRT